MLLLSSECSGEKDPKLSQPSGEKEGVEGGGEGGGREGETGRDTQLVVPTTCHNISHSSLYSWVLRE